MGKFTSFVVDDILQANTMLQEDLKRIFPEMEILGSASSVLDAVKKLQTLTPDILYLDIMLGDGTGFELLEILPKLNSKIIFVTANDDYAIKAFKYAAIDYILKPYSEAELEIATRKALQQLTPVKEQINILNSSLNNKDNTYNKITLHTLDKILIVDITSIIRCESDNNYTTFYLNDNTKVLVSRTLKYYSKLLEPLGFLRVHQSHLINTAFIKEYVKADGGYLVLSNNTSIPISTRKKPIILKFLNKI